MKYDHRIEHEIWPNSSSRWQVVNHEFYQPTRIWCKNDLNRLNSIVYNPTCMFCSFIENQGCTLLNGFQASPLDGQSMTTSTISCE